MTRAETLAATERMAAVLLGWTTPVIAREIAGNAAQGILGGYEPFEAAVASLRARIACGGVGIGEVAERAGEMEREWRA